MKKKSQKLLLTACFLLLTICHSFAQSDNSAIMNVESTEKGILIPRMTTTQRTSINNPAKGLLVFDNTTNSFWFYDGSNWSDLTGTIGATGPKGDVGPAGADGADGAQGLKGDTGAQGPAGANGTDGAQGLKGDTGAQGPAGANGTDGAQGLKGDTGAQGPAGANGTDGAQGLKGDTGDIGATGPKGDVGATGATGPKGDVGATGATGPKGDTGDAFWTQDNKKISYTVEEGKVVIGEDLSLSTPGAYRLYVEDGILAERVRVALTTSTNWADDAFGNKPSLKRMEKHIQKKSHLIGVPSAEELVKNGIDIAEMDATLLRQIEWLWEYTIESQRERKKLEEENRQLKKQFNLINKRLANLEKKDKS
ncbi:MAG: hypothetical protein AB8G86_21875 [Saprospiraceae bacterium]